MHIKEHSIRKCQEQNIRRLAKWLGIDADIMSIDLIIEALIVRDVVMPEHNIWGEFPTYFRGKVS